MLKTQNFKTSKPFDTHTLSENAHNPPTVKQPATSNKQPATRNQLPETSYQQPATSNQLPATI